MAAMKTRYVAYGLQVHSSFALPGMSANTDEGLPGLRLELASSAEFARAWSRPGGSTVWCGRLGDGRDLTIERGVADDLLFTYGDRARFRFEQSRRLLTCSPRGSGLAWQRVLLTKVIPTISVVLGYEALHASAVASPRGAVAIAAPSGMGKTTLAGELMRRGWPLLTDDVLTLATGQGGIQAYPGTPHMNLAHRPRERPQLQHGVATLGLLAGERWVAARAPARGPRRVDAVCLLERAPHLSLGTHIVSPSPLPLAGYILGLSAGAQRRRRRFALYADLASSARLIRLTCSPGDPPANVADTLERALEGRPLMAAIGGAA
jgi:hypothetical protein